jgi:hypothetical protein
VGRRPRSPHDHHALFLELGGRQFSPGLGIEDNELTLGEQLGDVMVGEKIEVVVESDVENGRTVLINIENEVLPVGWIQRVLVDNVEIGLADDYADVLDPTDENVPEYLILKGGKGAQVLVSIPSFSTRTIAVAALPTLSVAEIPPAYLIVVAALVLVVVVIVIIWRYLWVGARKLPKTPPAPPKAKVLP